jgi:Na+-translocating ferredoxin:NAD+ oxidoreductase subunit B
VLDVDALDALLPQTQCRQCGFAGCRPYAQALVEGQAPTDRCAPGGSALIQVLDFFVADSSNIPASHDVQSYSFLSPIQLVRSADEVTVALAAPKVAWIDESQCIGCALCLAVCPVDAIVGAPQWMHTVLEADCTGCALCVAPCPVECIYIEDHPAPDSVSGYAVSPEKSRQSYLNQRTRRSPEQHQKAERLLALYHPVETIKVAPPKIAPPEERSALIDRLRARAKSRREGSE